MFQIRFSMTKQKYTEEKVTVIMKLTAIKLLMLCMFAASFFFFLNKLLNKQS